jgi:alpha-L-rhamnosidase
MTAFLSNLERRFPDLVRADPRVERWQGFGDWLATDGASSGDARVGNTPRDLIGTAFFCYSAKLLARIAGVLGNLTDLERYEELAQRIRAAFRRRFVSGDGRLVGETQTSYVLALHFGLLDERERGAAVDWLVADIEGRKQHLSTGFVGTPYLLHVLTNHGHVDLAYRLLLQTTPPSWLYPVTQGATTIWERWDGWTEERGFQDPAMNSFNHYAYGAVGEWLYGTLAGLELEGDLSPRRNAYRHARIHPRPPIGPGFKVHFPGGPPVRYASAVLDTMYGRFETSWELTASRFRLKVTVPPNCRATVVLPDGEIKNVVAGRHEFGLAVGEGEDTGPAILHELSQVAS